MNRPPASEAIPRGAVGSGSARIALGVLSVGSIAFALAARWVHRGPYYPGWDVLGAAQGLHLVASKTPLEILRWLAAHHYDALWPWNAYGVPLTLLPGWLALHWPWDYWSHVVTFGLTLASLWLVGRSLGLRREQWIVLLLAWGASPALLSWSIAGLPYLSATWPHALAIWIVSRWKERWIATALLCAAALELSWHTQELGRTVFVVFLAATLFVRGAPRSTRLVWAMAGIWQLVDAWRHPSLDVARYSHLSFGIDAGERLLALLRWVFLDRYVDLPVLFAVGVIAALLVRRDPWFWRVLLGAQIALVVVLALNTGVLQGVQGVWPRRFLLVDFLCLVLVGALYRETSARPILARSLVAVLLVGNAWQLADTWRWLRTPLDHRGRGWDFTLPFTHNPLDGVVHFAAVDWAREIRAEVEHGRKVLLVYNLSSYHENPTDPMAILERLYLQLGPERFSDSVFVYGSQTVRWNEFPVRPISELEPFVRDLADPGVLVGYHRVHPTDEPRYQDETRAILDTIGRHWRIVWDPEPVFQDDAGSARRFTLRRAP